MRSPVIALAAVSLVGTAWAVGCSGAGSIAPLGGMTAELGCSPTMSGSNSIVVAFTCAQQGAFATSATIDATEQGFPGPFSASSSDSTVVSVSGSGARFTVSAGAPGSAHVTLSDGRGNDKDIDVDVKDREESPEPGESESPEPTESP